tara:strand:+ start:4363 stop:4737 length:375 start_codon:yes stop_codon:yes gene_type:complete
MSVSLYLPLPPSTNRLRIPQRGRLVTSREYRRWQDDAMMALLKQGRTGGGLIDFEEGTLVDVSLTVHRESNRRQDIDNRTKAVLDIISGIVYADDAQIAALHVYRGEKRQPGGVAVEVREVVSE